LISKITVTKAFGHDKEGTVKQKILFCANLDRTLLPNGSQAESPRARFCLQRLAQRPEISLVYVSNRHRAMIQSIIREYILPLPNYMISDGGATLYEIVDNKWRICKDWSEEIGVGWRGMNHAELAELFAGIEGLRLREPKKQTPFKLSYYVAPDLSRDRLMADMEQRLSKHGVQASLIWSVSKTTQAALLDILPKRANTLVAIRFLMERQHFDKRHTLFAGGDKNDLEVLTSGLQAILVRNTPEEVREEVLRRLPAEYSEQLYLARGSFMGLNGYYSAGVLEGLAYFFSETRAWMEERGKNIAGGKSALQPCAIYRSCKKGDSYLYVENKDDFSRVPKKLLELLGRLDFVMRLELCSTVSLAQADVQEVMGMLREKGYFLQLAQKEYRPS
jgi:HAD superfamily hydrolase (TIGR01484 family)